MHVKKNPTDPGKSLVGLSNLFLFTWNFVSRLKQTFLQITFSLLADAEPIKIHRQLIGTVQPPK